MSRHRFDTYGHSLVDTGDARLEGQINDLAVAYVYVRDTEKSKARAISLRTELLTLCITYFRVVGQGMAQIRSSYDDTLIDTLLWCLEHFDPATRPFTHYVRFKYPKMILTAGNKEKAFEEKLVDLVEQSKNDRDTSDDVILPALIEDEEEQQTDEAGIAAVNAVVAEFITLVVDFLDHAGDKAHSDRAKLYLKMNFTEWATYAVKAQPVFDWCAPFQNEEARIFATIEDGFLDVYMADVCRTVRKLWSTNLRDGYGEIINLDDERMMGKNAPAPWKLATSVHRDYLAGLGIKVSPAVISQHRKRFNELKSQLMDAS